MSEYTVIKTKKFRGQGFMTVCKYNNAGDIIYIGDKDSKIISAIDTYDYNIIGTFPYHNGVIWSLDISKDDNILISASGDLTIGFFNSKDGKKLYQSYEKCIPKYVCAQKSINATNKVAIICEALTKKSPTYISIFDLDNINEENFSHEVKLLWSRDFKPLVMIWNDDNELLIGCEDGKIIKRKIVDLSGDDEKEYLIHSGAIKSIMWNKTQTNILTGSLDCTAKCIDPSNEFKIMEIYNSSVPVNCASWNHNERKVILGGGIEAMNVAKTSDNDLNIKIYRVKDQKLTNHIASHFGPIRFIDKAPNSKNFMSASQDGSVKIYFLTEEESNNDNEKIESNEIFTKTKINKFGENFDKNIELIDETNKIINLSWKPPKEITKKVQKWIPGMPISQKSCDNGFEVANFSNDMNKKLEELKKKEELLNSTIRVTNLPREIKFKDLYDLFDLYGRIEDRGIKIKNYGDTTMAFIKYAYPESAIKAIYNMDGYCIDYMIIKVELAKLK